MWTSLSQCHWDRLLWHCSKPEKHPERFISRSLGIFLISYHRICRTYQYSMKWLFSIWVTLLSLFAFMHWRGKWQPTPVFLPGESQGQRSLVGYLYGVTQSWTRLKWLSSSSSTGEILVPWPGIEPVPLQWKCGVLPTGWPGKSQIVISFNSKSGVYEAESKPRNSPLSVLGP